MKPSQEKAMKQAARVLAKQDVRLMGFMWTEPLSTAFFVIDEATPRIPLRLLDGMISVLQGFRDNGVN